MRLRARHGWLVVAAAAAPLCVSACELIAGVHDVRLGGGGSGGSGGSAEAGSPPPAEAGPDAPVEAGPDAPDADASTDSPPDGCGDAGVAASLQLDAGPTTALPMGYASYCSLSGWSLYVNAADCATALAEGGAVTIERAGFYSVSGSNNVIMRCTNDPLSPRHYSGIGTVPLLAAFDLATTPGAPLHGCIFTAAPAALPVFSRPYGAWQCQTDPDFDVDTTDFQVFNYDVYQQPWNVEAFGQAAYPPDSSACAVDRTGHEQCHYGSAAECGGTAGCLVVPPGRPTGDAYVWKMPMGKPLLAVANGVVVGSRDRDVSGLAGCAATSLQKEIYIRHEIVGNGPFSASSAESFVTGYIGVSEREVAVGDVVAAGQEIGKAGATGCIQHSSLTFLVVRLTNITGAHAYTFATTDAGLYGINGIQGIIRSLRVDQRPRWTPGLWMYVGYPDPDIPPPVTDPGAFSINLWIPGQAPPTVP